MKTLPLPKQEEKFAILLQKHIFDTPTYNPVVIIIQVHGPLELLQKRRISSLLGVIGF